MAFPLRICCWRRRKWIKVFFSLESIRRKNFFFCSLYSRASKNIFISSIFITRSLARFHSIHPNAQAARSANMPWKEFLLPTRYKCRAHTSAAGKMAFQGQINWNLISRICFKCLSFPHVVRCWGRKWMREISTMKIPPNKCSSLALARLCSDGENWVIKSRRHEITENAND